MKAPTIRRHSLKKVSKDLKELKQLHDLSSIETVVVTISFAILVLGINIYLSPNANAWWKIASLFLIMYSVYPVTLFFGTFLAKDVSFRVYTLEKIILLSGLHLTGMGILALTIWLLSYEIIQGIISFFGILNLNPLIIFLIFEFWGIYLYYYEHYFIPYNEKVRFSSLVKPKEIKNHILLFIRRFVNFIPRERFIYFTFIVYAFILYWCLILREYLQIIIIVIIAIGNSYLIYKHKKLKI